MPTPPAVAPVSPAPSPALFAVSGPHTFVAATAPVFDDPPTSEHRIIDQSTGEHPIIDHPASAHDREDRDERSLRGLIGGGSSQVNVQAALRARDASRPTEADLAYAEATLTIVHRGWVPRDN
jgi:hypothetical protein